MQQPTFELKIFVNEKGEVSVTGPIDQKLICYGLLECARQLIQAHVGSPIVKPTQGDVRRVVN